MYVNMGSEHVSVTHETNIYIYIFEEIIKLFTNCIF